MFFGRCAPWLSRVELRQRMVVYVRELLGEPACKNDWTLVEAAGDARSDSMQRLLNFSPGTCDGLRDDVRDR